MEKSFEGNSRDRFLLDTSAFLSLESVHLMDTILDLFSVVTTTSVLRELESFALYEDVLGLIAGRVLNKKKT